MPLQALYGILAICQIECHSSGILAPPIGLEIPGLILRLDQFSM
jgi:hypothetical protein